MITFQRSQLVKEMITRLIVYYNYFNKYYKMIAIDLSKHEAPDANPKIILQIIFTENLV